MATISERIKALREEAGLSQPQLAEVIGVQKNTVSRWELGKVKPDYVNCMLMATYFKVTYAYLMGMTDDREAMVLTEDEEEEREAQEAKQDEEQMLMLYRKLSPEMQKMIRTNVAQAYLIDKDR